MTRWLSLVMILGCLGALGCGASEPRESDIFHDPALRAGTAEASSPAERALLARLGTDPDAGPLEVEGTTFVLDATYHAASGRRCREISGDGGRRLVCENDDGWTFVPDVRGPR